MGISWDNWYWKFLMGVGVTLNRVSWSCGNYFIWNRLVPSWLYSKQHASYISIPSPCRKIQPPWYLMMGIQLVSIYSIYSPSIAPMGMLGTPETQPGSPIGALRKWKPNPTWVLERSFLAYLRIPANQISASITARLLRLSFQLT